MSSQYTGFNNYANYHTFSKLQVGNKVNFGGAINRSGHTVTNTDAWLDDVPFYRAFTTPAVILSSVGSSLVKNDLVEVTVAGDGIATGLYRRNATAWSEGATFSQLFDAYTIGTDKKDGATVLLNQNDKAVVRVWKDQVLTFLDADNNAKADSEGQAARIIINGAPVEQFIAQPDVCRSGYPSGGYAIEVKRAGSKLTMDFGTVADTFFDVPFAGTIMFGGGTDPSKSHTINCFEYIGDKLAAVNTKISDIQKTIENLTIEAGEGIKQVKAGEGITVATEGVEGATALTPVVTVDTTVIATKASVDAVVEDVSKIQQTIESGVVSSVTASAAAQTAGITIGGTDTEPEIQVTVGTVSETSDAVVTGKAVAAAIDTAKTTLEGTISRVESAATTGISEAKAAAEAAQDAADAAQGDVDALAQTVETNKGAAEAAIALKADQTALDTAVSTLEGKISAAQSAAQSAAEATAKAYTDTEVKKVADDLAEALDKHTEDIETVQAAVTALSTSGFSRVIVTELPTTNINLNAIYLIKNTNSEAGEYIEYIYVGELGEGGTGSIENFEQIGSTKTDLSEYAKTADVTETLKGYTTTGVHEALATRVTTAEGTIAANTAAAATAQAAADKAQGDVDALTQTVATNKTAAETGISEAKAAAKAADDKAVAAQGEIDDLEGIVSALSQTVTDNKTTTDAAIATKAAQTALDATNATVAEHTAAIETLTTTTIPGITGRLDAIEEIPVVEVVAAESTAEVPNYVTVSSNTADGKTTFTVASTGVLETRLDTLESFVGGSGTPGEGLSELLAKKVDNVIGGSNGITISTADTETGRVATLNVIADTSVTENSANVVTSGAVHTAINSSSSSALTSAKEYTEEQIDALKTELNAGTVTAENTAVSVTQTNGKITAVTVTKGAVAAGNTNLVDGATVYAETSALNTAVSKKLDSSEYATDKQALNETISGITGRLDTAEGEIDTIQEFVAGADAAYAVKGTETVAADAAEAADAAQTSADKKLASITVPTGSLLNVGTPTADGDTKSVEISLAANVATVDATDVDGSVYTKEQVDEMVANAAPDNYITSINGSTGAQAFTIKDSRETVYTNDLWATSVTTVDGTISINHDYIVNPNADEYSAWDRTIKSVKDNKAYTSVDAYEGLSANIQTNMIKDGTFMFHSCPLFLFDSDLSALTNATSMFYGTSLASFSCDLNSLINGSRMFEATTTLKSFDSNLDSLVIAENMFQDSQLASFDCELNSLVNGEGMFYNTKLASFCHDLSSLVNGELMFAGAPLKSFAGDLSSLINGVNMFYGVELDYESLEIICDSLTPKSQIQSYDIETNTYHAYDGTGNLNYKYKDVDGIKSTIITDDQVCTISIQFSNTGLSNLTEEDIAVITALFEETAQTKGWTIITDAELGGTHTPSVTAADGTVQHYIYAIKHEATEETATHVDANGKFWTVDTAEAIIGPNVQYWSIFASLEDAVAEWELTAC